MRESMRALLLVVLLLQLRRVVMQLLQRGQRVRAEMVRQMGQLLHLQLMGIHQRRQLLDFRWLRVCLLLQLLRWLLVLLLCGRSVMMRGSLVVRGLAVRVLLLLVVMHWWMLERAILCLAMQIVTRRSRCGSRG